MNSSITTPPLFTISQIARALGCSRQNVHQQLASIPCDGEEAVGRQFARAWRVETIPPNMLRDLAAIAQRKRYTSVAMLLSEPVRRFEPAVPFAELAETARDKALRLQRALRPFLLGRNSPEAKTAEFETRGTDHYRRVFGHPITVRHWRALFDRTIDRDAGLEEWERPEIYVADNAGRLCPNSGVSVARDRRLSVLEDALVSIAQHGALNVDRKDYLWMKACDEHRDQLAAGIDAMKSKRAIIRALHASRLLGCDKETVRRNFDRHWTTYCRNDGIIRDRRRARDSGTLWTEDDFRKLVARALDCGGRVAQAHRELVEDGAYSKEFAARLITNPSRKSYVPESLRKRVAAEVKRLMPYHRGPREHQLRGAFVSRDYTSLHAGDSYQADDITCPVYYWEPDHLARSGVRAIRGQLLLMIDERSLLALGFALHSEENYNARVIRALITRVHDAYGLPRRRFYFERGIWRDARILTGAKDAYDLPLEHTELGLREFGISFVHARLPRGKVIERVIGILQNRMERLPGYVGRNETTDEFERVQEQLRGVRSGVINPSHHLMSREEWETQLAHLLHQYNCEKQEGRILRGMSPLQAWNALQSSEGQIHLGGAARWKLASHSLPMKVQRNGITLRDSLGGATYCSEATGAFMGETVTVLVNPESLESIGIMSLDGRRGPLTIPRLDPVPTIDATPEQFSTAAALVNAHNGYTPTVYRTISAHLAKHNFRKLYADQRTTAIGEELERGEKEVKVQKRQLRRNVRNITRHARVLGIDIDLKQRGIGAVEDIAEGVDMMAESRRLREPQKECR